MPVMKPWRVISACGALGAFVLPLSCAWFFPSKVWNSGDDGSATTSEGGTPCPKGAFCDDFDDGQTLVPPWDDLSEGSVQIDDAESYSPPGSLLSTLSADQPGQCRYAQVLKNLCDAGGCSVLSMSFDFRYDDPAMTNVFMAAEFFGNDNGPLGCGFVFVADPTSPMVEEQSRGGAGDNNLGWEGGIDAGAWHSVSINYDTRGTFVVVLDGAMVIDSGITLPECRDATGPVVAKVGLHCIDQRDAGLAVHIDNVVLDPH
jgi:hypothetical protein